MSSKNQKVAGHTHLMRRSTVPGALVNTNNNGFNAFINARKRAQSIEDMRDELEILREAVSALQESMK